MEKFKIRYKREGISKIYMWISHYLIMLLFPYSGSIAPIVGTGVNIGHGDGINPEVGSNIVYQNDEIEYQINGGANFGTLENILGNLEHIGNIGQGIFGGR